MGGDLLVGDKSQYTCVFIARSPPTHRAWKETPVFHSLGLPNPWNCWSGVSPRIKSSCVVNKGQECIKHPNPFTCDGGVGALWWPKCAAFKWKGLFFASLLLHSTQAHFSVFVIAVFFYLYFFSKGEHKHQNASKQVHARKAARFYLTHSFFDCDPPK